MTYTKLNQCHAHKKNKGFQCTSRVHLNSNKTELVNDIKQRILQNCRKKDLSKCDLLIILVHNKYRVNLPVNI